MSSYEALAVEIKDNVARVTLLGPGKGNAMGPAFWKEMPVVFAELDADPQVRAIVITGSGKHFSFGLDLMAMGPSLPSAGGGEASARSRTNFHTMVKQLRDSITAVAECRTPTVAAVHGWCIGGGVDLISAADIRYASADAKFSVREVRKLAIVADVGSLARLPYMHTDGHLRELALTGKDIDAHRAEKIGLVTTCCRIRRPVWPPRTPPPPRSPPTRRWRCGAHQGRPQRGAHRRGRRQPATSPPGTPRSCRRISRRPFPRCSRSGRRTSPANRTVAEADGHRQSGGGGI